MLADEVSLFSAGQFAQDIHKPKEFLFGLTELISKQLPLWRDRKDRQSQIAETRLTSQFCAHLSSVTRHLPGWDILQFRTEEPDETQANRSLDLIAAPAGCRIVVDGRNYSDFDPLLPIECKRLPTPKGSKRDEREYVFSDKSTTGGIDRFKQGFHGAAHDHAMMIGYVQSCNHSHWHKTINDWITGLKSEGATNWTDSDLLKLINHWEAQGLTLLDSSHIRSGELTSIAIKHAWIQMS